jgi:predicted dehydrogenase
MRLLTLPEKTVDQMQKQVQGKFAIIGCEHGHIGIFVQEMLDLGYECAGIYEPSNHDLAHAIGDPHGIPIIDDRELLLGDDVTIIGSSAVNRDKIAIVELCEQRGKSIMLDKPAVVDRAGLQKLEQVMERGKIHVGMLLTERARPGMYTLAEHIREGLLGEIVSIGIRKPHRLSPQSRRPWFFDNAQCGGIIVDLLIHDFDLLRWLTGKEIVQMSSYIGKNILPEHPTFYDAASVQVLLDGGITAQLYADWHTSERSWTWGDCRIFVSGTLGCAEIRLEGDPLLSDGNEGLYLQVTDKESWHRVELMESPLSITGDFVNRVKGGPGLLSHKDIRLASKASIESDESAIKVGRLAVDKNG